MDVMEHITIWKREAYDLGVEQARGAASWVTDGNDSDESRKRKLADIEAYGVDVVISAPNLSGEWADSLTPRVLFEQVTGLDAHAEASYNLDAYEGVSEELCSSFEDGVGDTFESAVVEELERWL